MAKQPEPTSTIEQLQAARLEQRRKAAERYRELLLRNDNPKAGDADALIAVLQVLDRQLGDLPHDITLVRALVASEEAERQAQELAGPCEKARQAFQKVKARTDQERVDFERGANERVQAAETALRKLTAERHSLHVASEQAPRDEWTALVEGMSTDEARAARRAARRPTAAPPPPPDREEVIERCRVEMVLQNLAPAAGSASDRVNAELAACGLDPLTDDEIAKHGIESWLPRHHRSGPVTR